MSVTVEWVGDTINSSDDPFDGYKIVAPNIVFYSPRQTRTIATAILKAYSDHILGPPRQYQTLQAFIILDQYASTIFFL